MKLQVRKISKTIEENKLKVMKKDFYGNSSYIQNSRVKTKIMKRTKRTYPHPTSIPVTVFLIAKKPLSP